MSEYDEIMEGLNEVLDIKTRQTDIGIDLMLSMAEVKMLKREVERLKAENDHLKAQLGKVINTFECVTIKGKTGDEAD